MTALRHLIPILALCVLILPPQGADARLIRPVAYGPWGLLCDSAEGINQPLTCRIRYQSDENEVQWEVVLQHDGARVVTWGRNKSNCRHAQVTEAVDRNYRLARPTLEESEMEEFADRALQVMRSHLDFFGDCYNPRGRAESISPTVLEEASPDFIRAFVAAEGSLRAVAVRAEAGRDAR